MNKCSQVKNALKYTVGFAIVCVVLLLIGAFVPLEAPPGQNSTQWEKVQYLFEELGSSRKYSLFRKYLYLTFIIVVSTIPLFNKFIPPYPFIRHRHYSLNVKSLAPIHFNTA
ncbi:hypothetical protein FQN60_015105 [Etheostoma spectabile]|uniref:Uncharacterized protein n=1 Tax=Etheostoma spectabile TaxID=54343 RepID=A0A5J5CQA0_9PERO|nr:hypothetical protein FQN60_015105 [Etheostoma spectabile]